MSKVYLSERKSFCFLILLVFGNINQSTSLSRFSFLGRVTSAVWLTLFSRWGGGTWRLRRAADFSRSFRLAMAFLGTVWWTLRCERLVECGPKYPKTELWQVSTLNYSELMTSWNSLVCFNRFMASSFKQSAPCLRTGDARLGFTPSWIQSQWMEQ